MSQPIAAILVGCSVLLASNSLAGEVPPSYPNANAVPIQDVVSTTTGGQQNLAQAWRDAAIWLAPTVLLFALLLIFLNFVGMWKSGKFWTDRSFKAFALTLIICAGLFLIVIGFSDQQLAPMMGLLGTLAGYILGAEVRGDEGVQASVNEDAEKP